jgi:hypothetical protein
MTGHLAILKTYKFRRSERKRKKEKKKKRENRTTRLQHSQAPHH